MSQLSRNKFLETMPGVVMPLLPDSLKSMRHRQPWRWLVQFHYGEPRLHYELAPVFKRGGWELGFHCEARDKDLNRLLLNGFRHNLFEIKDALGERVEAEMWDRGWTKIYEVVEEEPLTADFQARLATRVAEFITCLHPVYVDLRNSVARAGR